MQLYYLFFLCFSGSGYFGSRHTHNPLAHIMADSEKQRLQQSDSISRLVQLGLNKIYFIRLGSFSNYVDQFLSNFYHLPTSSGQSLDWTSMDF